MLSGQTGIDMNLAAYIDHTLLKPDASIMQIEAFCREAVEYGFASVCVHSCNISICKKIIKNQKTAICIVTGFPFGANMTSAKAFETELALEAGADEIDMVMNIGAFKDKRYDYVVDDIRKVKAICGDKILKVIIETAYLNDKEKIEACRICIEANADYVKTSTGFGPSGATIEDIRLIKKTVGDSIKIKAAGGIKTRAFAEDLIKAGADRLGTSSSIAVMKGRL